MLRVFKWKLPDQRKLNGKARALLNYRLIYYYVGTGKWKLNFLHGIFDCRETFFKYQLCRLSTKNISRICGGYIDARMQRLTYTRISLTFVRVLLKGNTVHLLPFLSVWKNSMQTMSTLMKDKYEIWFLDLYLEKKVWNLGIYLDLIKSQKVLKNWSLGLKTDS